MKLRILSVGCGWFEKGGIENYSFDDAPSFSDYNAVIINPISISLLWRDASKSSDGSLYTQLESDRGLGNNLIKLMNKRIGETKILMERTGGVIICFAGEISKVLNIKEVTTPRTGYGGYYKVIRKIHIYSWLPPELFEQIHFTPRQGETVSEIKRAHPLSSYFDAFKNEISYKTTIEVGRVSSNIIAMNKVEDIISAEFPFENGKIVFLPPLKNLNKDPKKLAGILIGCIHKLLEWTPSSTKPPWIDKYKLPNEEEIEEARKEIEGKKEKIKKEEDKVVEKGNEIEIYKSLLYGQGKYILEPAVRKTFKLIGFNVIPPEKYNEDYDLYIEENNLIIIGEVEGSKNKIDVQKFYQLRHYVEEKEGETTKKVKGLLIGNGLIDKKPGEREEQFTEHAIGGCKRQDFCWITTFELFKTVKRILQDPEDKNLKNSIKEKIINCNSEFKLQKRKQ